MATAKILRTHDRVGKPLVAGSAGAVGMPWFSLGLLGTMEGHTIYVGKGGSSLVVTISDLHGLTDTLADTVASSSTSDSVGLGEKTYTTIPSYRSSAYTSTAVADAVVSSPAGVTDGDIVFAIVLDTDGVVNSGLHNIPTGFTSLGQTGGFGLFTNGYLRVGWKIASSEPASYTFVGTGGTTCGLVAYRNHSGLDVVGSFATTATADSITTAYNNDKVLYIGGGPLGNGFTPPSGYTTRASMGSGPSLFVADKTMTTAGSTGSAAGSIANSGLGGAGSMQVALGVGIDTNPSPIIAPSVVLASEVLGSTDTEVSTAIVGGISETAGMTDTRVAEIAVPVSESEGSTDTMSPGPGGGVSDTVGLTDTEVSTATVGGVSDTVGIADTVVQQLIMVLTDPEGLTDSPVVVLEGFLNNTVGLIDATIAGPLIYVTDSEDLTDADESTELFPDSDEFPNSDEFPGSSVGTTFVVATVVATISDDEGLTDSTSYTLTMQLTEAEGLTDPKTVTVNTVLPNETEGLTDGHGEEYGTNPNDPVGITDTTTQTLVVNLVEDVFLVDAPNKTTTVVSTITAHLTDNAGLTDLMSVGVTVLASDTEGVTDTSTASLVAAISEALGLTDTVFSNLTVQTSDTEGLTDALEVTFDVAVQDLVDLTDVLDAVLTIGLPHIHIDTIILRAADRVINISVQGMPMNMSVSTVELDAGTDDAIAEDA